MDAVRSLLRRRKLVLGIAATAAAILSVLAAVAWWPASAPGTPAELAASAASAPAGTVPVAVFLDAIQTEAIDAAAIDADRSTAAFASGGTTVTTAFLASQEDEVLAALAAAGADPVVVDGRGAAGIPIGSAVVLLLLVASLAAVGGRALAQRGYRARSPHARQRTAPATRFADIAGCDEAVEDLRELVLALREPERFAMAGARIPKGALLVGPPGTGKTLLARAVAGEAGVPFYAASGSDMVEMYVGVGASRIRSLFAKARRHPEGAIVFLDEVDAVGRSRSGASAGGSQEHDQTLNALLVEMDGFSDSRVIVLAATNRPDTLDPALTRPGRLDRRIPVALPDRRGRAAILAVHAASRPMQADADLDAIARRTPGMSGAELARLVNEACLAAARQGAASVADGHLEEALATVTVGRARTSALVDDRDRLLTAWHEAGHAVCGLVLAHAQAPAAVSIVPRGQAGGVTHFPGSDRGFTSRSSARAQLVVAMGGLAAEQLHLGEGEWTTGPSSDLQQATQLAVAMVARHGMGDRLLVTPDEVLASGGGMADRVLAEADALLRDALDEARGLLSAHRPLVLDMVAALLEHETLDAVGIQALASAHLPDAA